MCCCGMLKAKGAVNPTTVSSLYAHVICGQQLVDMYVIQSTGQMEALSIYSVGKKVSFEA